jgi:hypothetical protein
MRRHLDRGSEDFRGLSSRAEGVSLRIGSVGVSCSAASRTGVRPGKLGRALRSFSRALRRRSESSLRRPVQGALYLLPLVLHLTLEAVHVPLALFAVTETRQVIPRTPYATRASV